MSENSTMTKEEFQNLILMGKSKTRYKIVYFILNTLHKIVNSGDWYCYCPDIEDGKCKICTIPIIFSNFEKEVEKIFLIITFCSGITLNFAMNSFNFLVKKKIVTGAAENTEVYLSLKVFNTMKRSMLIDSNLKNYLFRLNFRIRQLI